MIVVTPEWIECKNCQLSKECKYNKYKIFSGCYEGIDILKEEENNGMDKC